MAGSKGSFLANVSNPSHLTFSKPCFLWSLWCWRLVGCEGRKVLSTVSYSFFSDPLSQTHYFCFGFGNNDVDFPSIRLLSTIAVKRCWKEYSQLWVLTNPSPSHLSSLQWRDGKRVQFDTMIISLDHLFVVRVPEVLSGLSVCEALLFHNMFCFKKT